MGNKNNSVILGSIFLTIIVLLSSCNNDQKEYLSIVENFRVLGITSVDETIIKLSKLAESENSSAELLAKLSDILYIRYQYKSLDLKDIEVALNYINRALFLIPNVADYLQKRALYFLLLKQTTQAAADLDKALTIQPAHAEAWSLKIEMLLSDNRLLEAEDAAYQAMLNWDSLAVPAIPFSEIFYVNQLWSVALDLLEIADQKTSDSFFMQGVCYQELDQYNKAVSAYKNALSITESNETRYRLSAMLLKSKQYQPAIEQMRVLIKKSPEEVKYWSQLAQIYALEGNVSRAVATLLNVERFGDALQKQQARNSIINLSEAL